MATSKNSSTVIPAQCVLLGLQPLTTTTYSLRVQAGIQRFYQNMHFGLVPRVAGVLSFDWIPACAGMTNY